MKPGISHLKVRQPECFEPRNPARTIPYAHGERELRFTRKMALVHSTDSVWEHSTISITCLKANYDLFGDSFTAVREDYDFTLSLELINL